MVLEAELREGGNEGVSYRKMRRLLTCCLSTRRWTPCLTVRSTHQPTEGAINTVSGRQIPQRRSTVWGQWRDLTYGTWNVDERRCHRDSLVSCRSIWWRSMIGVIRKFGLWIATVPRDLSFNGGWEIRSTTDGIENAHIVFPSPPK
jgi:hypothetical protein